MDTSSQKKRLSSTLYRICSGKPFLIAVAVLLIYALSGFFLVPHLIKDRLKSYVTHQLHRQLNIEKVRFNPFALSVELSDVSLLEADGSQLFSFQRFFANFKLMSLIRRAWTFGEIGLSRPELSVRLESDGGMNLGRLVSDASKKDEAKAAPAKTDEVEGKAPRLFFDRIHVSDGHLLFVDHSDVTPTEIHLDPINFEINQLSTIPDREGEHTISATLPKGGSLKWAGTTSLEPFESKGTLALNDLKKSIIWQFLQDELNLAQPTGTADLKLNYFISNRDGVFQFVLDKVTAVVSGLELMLKGSADSRFLTLNRIRLSDGRFDLASKNYTVGRLEISDGDLMLKTDPSGNFNWQRIVADNRTESNDTEPTQNPNDAPFDLRVEKVDLSNVALKFVDESRQTPMDLDVGRIDLSLSLKVDKSTTAAQMVLNDIILEVGEVSLRQVGEDDSLVDLPITKISAGPVDFAARKAIVSDISLAKGQVALWVDQEGVFNFSRFKGRGDDANETTDSTDRPNAKTEQAPWSFELSSARLDDFDLSFTDRGIAAIPVYDLNNLHLGLKDLKSDPNANFSFDVSFDVKQGGKLSAKGHANPFKPSVAVNVDLDSLGLSPMGPYLQSIAKVTLNSGDLSIDGDFKYGAVQSGALAFSGRAGIDQLLVKLPKTNETLLSWKQFDTRGIQYSTLPAGLVINEINLSEPSGKLVIQKDKRVNFSDVIVKRDESTKKSTDSNPFPVDIKRVRMSGGKLDFADFSLLFPFNVKIHGLSGTMAGLSSQPTSRASVDLKGRVQRHGTVLIKGNLQPFDFSKYFDMAMTFKNLEMTELTPYTAEFAGRKISSGKLFLDLNYRINDSQLQAENDLVLDYFVLGERVEAAKAANLPLDLAVALLKDADDRIDIGLPVSGNLEDPQFRYGHLIWKAFVNLITKIVAAPFKALGGLLGTDQEKMDTVAFEAGESELPPQQVEKLTSLAGALGKRPQLHLEIQGCYDTAADGRLMQENTLKRELARRMGLKPATDQGPDQLNFSDAGVQKAVLSLAGERLELEKLDTLKATFGMSTESKKTNTKPAENQKTPKKPSEDPVGFYSKVFEELVTREPLNENGLAALSDKRSQAILDELTQTNGLPLERTRVIDPAKSADLVNGQIACKLNLTVNK